MKKWNHKSIRKLIKESDNYDPIIEIQRRARNLVLMALENGWNGPPFDSISLAKYLGFQITPNETITDARTVPLGSKSFLIEYNPFQKPTRINFSVAHEIAHTLFSDCAEVIRNREEDPNENRELEQLCNIGASEIQLPYAIFSNDANSIERISLEALIELATKYKASLESLFIRFVQVVDKPCAILICSFITEKTLSIEYYKGSNNFNASIPSSFVIPKESKAYECKVPGWSSRETINWNVLGATYNIYSIGISPLRKDNRGRVGILIVPLANSTNIESRKINIEFGDATKPRGEGKKIIAQVVNTSGALGLGFGKSLAKNYPEVKSNLKEWQQNKNGFVLGASNLIQVDKNIYVFQMLAQKGLFEKNGEIPLRYSSLRECLLKLYEESKTLKASIHMPLIGAGQAKGDWKIIEGMLHDELTSKGAEVNVYILPGKVSGLKSKTNLTTFKEETTWSNKK